MEEEKDGISVGDIFRIIFSQKWLALIIAAVIAIAGTLALYFGYNYIKEGYSLKFTLVLPEDDLNSVTYQYPDGQPFHYLELISKSTLNAVVQDGDGKFDDVNVDAIYNNGGISITDNSDNLRFTESGEIFIIKREYTLNASAKYFKNDDVAREFLTAIANYPRKYLSNLKIDYDGALEQFKVADSYLKQIDYLNQQISFIKQKYTRLIELCKKDDFVVANGKTLKNCLDDITAYAESYEFANLSQELKAEWYLKSEHTLESYKLELNQVTEDLEDAKKVLEKMLKTESDTQVNTEAVRVQAEKVVKLERRQSDLNDFIEHNNVDTEGVFAKRLDGVYNKVLEHTKTLQTVSVIVYTSSSKVYVSEYKLNGHMGIVITILISVVAGLIIAAVIAYVVGWVKLKKTNAQAKKPIEKNETTTE